MRNPRCASFIDKVDASMGYPVKKMETVLLHTPNHARNSSQTGIEDSGGVSKGINANRSTLEFAMVL